MDSPQDTASRLPPPESSEGPARVAVGVVAICGPTQLARCLDAIKRQDVDQPFEVVVVYDPELSGMDAVARDHPDVRFVANRGQRTPLELAARAVRETGGDLVILTEDHCVPEPHWIARLVDAQRDGRAAVGGSIEPTEDYSATEWAFSFVDYFRYMRPLPSGPSPSLTVCNVSYRRDYVNEIAPLWTEIFHETAINEALKDQFGSLWLEPDATVRVERRVRFRNAVYERYAFGRLFGCTRLDFCGRAKRLMYVLAAPALPVLLLGRMARKALQSRELAGRFVSSLPILTALVVAWSWGEWLGYVTARRPTSELVAPDRLSARQSA